LNALPAWALHLDANESPWGPPPADTSVSEYNRYPAQQPSQLRSRLAALYGVTADNIMMGRGADEAIDILLRTFCESGQDSILTCPPTFGYFKTAAQKLVFLCSPNNPTGNSLAADALESLCQNYPETLIVVDEAYIEFSSHESVIALRAHYRNLFYRPTRLPVQWKKQFYGL